jgi:hypothetical protein
MVFDCFYDVPNILMVITGENTYGSCNYLICCADFFGRDRYVYLLK